MVFEQHVHVLALCCVFTTLSPLALVFKPGYLASLESLKQANRQRESYALFQMKSFFLEVERGHRCFNISFPHDGQTHPGLTGMP